MATASVTFLIAAGLRRYLLLIGMNLIPFSSMRIALLRLCGVNIGKGCYIGFNVMPDTNYPSLITIGSNVTISHNTTLIAHTQSPVRSLLASRYDDVKQVTIGDGAWIGLNCILLPGAQVGRNTFIGAGSVVVSLMPDESMCAGNPCKFIKPIRN